MKSDLFNSRADVAVTLAARFSHFDVKYSESESAPGVVDATLSW